MVLVQNYEDGCLKAIDYDCMNGTMKLKWLKSYLIVQTVFGSISLMYDNVYNQIGLHILLKCDYNIKLPSKLSSCNQQVLAYQQMLYKHNKLHTLHHSGATGTCIIKRNPYSVKKGVIKISGQS